MQGEAVISYEDYIFPLSTIRAIFLGVRCNWMFAGNNVGLNSCSATFYDKIWNYAAIKSYFM